MNQTEFDCLFSAAWTGDSGAVAALTDWILDHLPEVEKGMVAYIPDGRLTLCRYRVEYEGGVYLPLVQFHLQLVLGFSESERLHEDDVGRDFPLWMARARERFNLYYDHKEGDRG